MSNQAFPSVFDLGWAVYEDFLTNDSITDANVGKNLWERDTIGNASTLTYETDQGETFMRMTTAGTADGDGEALSLKDDSTTVGTAGGYIRARVRYPDITGNQLAGNNFRIGITDVVTSGEPVVGIWIDSDAGVLSFDVASANGDLTAAAAAPADILTSGTTMVLGRIYDLEVRWHGNNGNSDPGPNVAQFFVNGFLAATITGVLLDGAETHEPKITHWQDTGGTATLELDVFGVEMASFREGK